MKIFFVHHALRKIGSPPSKNDDILPLGKKDAKITAKIFKELANKRPVNAIYTSPYFRCKKTAKIINKYLNVPIYDEPRFNEFNNVFKAVGGEYIKSGETWLDCQLRTREAIKDIVNKYDDNATVICITSGVNITAFISLAFNIEPSENLPFPLVPSCSPIGLDIDKKCF